MVADGTYDHTASHIMAPMGVVVDSSHIWFSMKMQVCSATLCSTLPHFATLCHTLLLSFTSLAFFAHLQLFDQGKTPKSVEDAQAILEEKGILCYNGSAAQDGA